MMKLTLKHIEKYFNKVDWCGIQTVIYEYKKNKEKRIVTGGAWYYDGYITVFIADKNHKQIDTFEQLISYLKSK